MALRPTDGKEGVPLPASEQARASPSEPCRSSGEMLREEADRSLPSQLGGRLLVAGRHHKRCVN